MDVGLGTLHSWLLFWYDNFLYLEAIPGKNETSLSEGVELIIIGRWCTSALEHSRTLQYKATAESQAQPEKEKGA